MKYQVTESYTIDSEDFDPEPKNAAEIKQMVENCDIFGTDSDDYKVEVD
jgi:hypothetical protein